VPALRRKRACALDRIDAHCTCVRAFEEEGIRKRSSEIAVSAPTAVTLYILNQKREALGQIEQRYGLHIVLAVDDSLIPPDFPHGADQASFA
jgi:Ribonuclease G/E